MEQITPDYFVNIFNYLSSAFPDFSFRPDTFKVYYESLKQYPHDKIFEAAKTLVTSKENFPRISDFIALLEAQRQG